MAAAARLLRSTRPLNYSPLSSSSYSSIRSSKGNVVACSSKADGAVEKRVSSSGGGGEGEIRRPCTAVKAVAAAAERIAVTEEESKEVDFGHLIGNITDGGLKLLRNGLRIMRPRPLLAEMILEKTIIDCRFFTFFGIAGTLLGSAICFLEGCFAIIESYLQYLRTMSSSTSHSHSSDGGGHVVELVIEAIDMFLLGTAMFVFGVGLYVMFVAPKKMEERSLTLPKSNFFGLFYLKSIPVWAGMESVSEAKSKIGHAVMMILQVGVLEKVKSVPLVTGVDLACFAATILLFSAGLFLLSRLALGGKHGG